MSDGYEIKYFAASNSRSGFVNYFPQCFGEDRGVRRLYVIKGGSGTGKSYFMRRAARCAEAAGLFVEYYYCSSDPASLDGVRITLQNGDRVGIIDGTPPHPWEPKLPGVVEEIINLGAFWDSRALAASGEEIRRLQGIKAAEYKAAYAYLSAAGQVCDVIEDCVRDVVYFSKMRAVAQKTVKCIPEGDRFDAEPALISSVGGRGEVKFNTYTQLAEKVYTVEDFYGVGHLMLREIFEASSARTCEVKVSYDPLCPHRIDGLFYPNASVAFVVGEGDGGEYCHSLGVRRFASGDALKERRSALRRAVGLRDSLVAGAVERFAGASRAHFDIEKIYSSAMDFDAKSKFEEEFCRKILDFN
ncbi:MAG: hypothetical protein IJX74_06410 [Clostridia bacterium]|nr:hypothetical protein [Clostridia bacterium]